jgi:hypothetical protein
MLTSALSFLALMPSLKERWGAFLNPQAAESAAETSIAPTPSNWVPVGGAPVQLSLANWHKCAQRNQKLSQQNGIYSRLLEIIKDNVWGLGVTVSVKAKTDEAKKYEHALRWAIDRFWRDPENNIETLLPAYIKEHAGYGEVAFPVRVNEQNGKVTLGYLPPLWIQDVQLNQNNVAEPLSLKTQNGTWKDSKKGGKMKWIGEGHTYNVIRRNNDPYLRNDKGEVERDENKLPIPNPDQNRLTGDIFYFRSLNNIGTARGYGDLVQVMDLCTNAEQFVYDFGEGYAIQQAYLWDLTIDGGTKKDIDAWSEMQVPVGQRFFAHNNKVHLEAKSPSLKAADATEFLRLLLRMILGSVGVPESGFADGSQTNVATAKEQMPMLYAKFNNRRSWWSGNLELVIRFVLEQANKAGKLYEYDESTKTEGVTVVLDDRIFEQFDISVEFMPFERNNSDGLGATLSTLADALEQFKEQGWISSKTAAKVARNQLSTFGVDIDEKSEDAAIAEDKKNAPVGASGEPIDMQDVAKASEAIRRGA